MESNSASNVESHNNLTETPDVGEKGEKKSEVNDSNIVYFDCKNCFNTFTKKMLIQILWKTFAKTVRRNNYFRAPYYLKRPANLFVITNILLQK